ncbi:MAG: restriction endonuclease [Syntrophales bacterium]
MLTQEQKNIIDTLSKVENISSHLSQLISDVQTKLNELKQYEAETNKTLQAKQNEIRKQILASEANLKEEREAFNRIVSEKTQGFPWLADAISQYTEFRDSKIADYLETKSHPAVSSAEKVRKIAAEKKEFQKKFIITRNLIKYYDALFPWLSDFVSEGIDELLIQAFQQEKAAEQDDDPVRAYLTKGEYENLSTTERNQKALDRYWTKKKTSWQIGRDYERYIGYLYEQKGFSVYYQGIEKGIEDLGRDLICKKEQHVEIVQCKYWREDRTIHEKHINQLFGTTVEYFIKNINRNSNVQMDLFPTLLKRKDLTATIVTSAALSETAKDFASILGIKVVDHFPFKKYPSIKCNVSYRDGSEIYHLPFDQQYDRTTINEERNECYVETAKEAETLGFRRAWKWRGNRE